MRHQSQTMRNGSPPGGRLGASAWVVLGESLALPVGGVATGRGAGQTEGGGLPRLITLPRLVQVGWGVRGAIAALPGVPGPELLIARRCVRPSFCGRVAPEARRLWGYGLPLFLFAA